MAQKHLFRFALENIPEGTDDRSRDHNERRRALFEELKAVDDILSKYFPIHVVPVDFEERQAEGYHEYARDAILQIGNRVYVKPKIATFRSNFELAVLFTKLSKFPFLRSKMEKEIRAIGYRGFLHPRKFPEGGQLVLGGKFGLVSDNFRFPSAYSGLAKIPVYPVHSFGLMDSHIDGDYGILDDAGILYSTIDVESSPAAPETANPLDAEFDKGYVTTKKSLEEIALTTGYEIRPYRDRKIPDTGDIYTDLAVGTLGINFLTNEGRLFTSGMHPEEQDFLKAKGIEVIEVSLLHTNPGAGLRCCYGELLL